MRDGQSRLCRSVRAGVFVLLLMVVSLVCLGLYVRMEATKAGWELSSTPSASGNCYLKTYVRQYSSLGVIGRIFGLFGSQFYYRVYSRNGELEKTSEWNFLEDQSVADEAAYWGGGFAFYPAVDGLAGWDLPSCVK